MENFVKAWETDREVSNYKETCPKWSKAAELVAKHGEDSLTYLTLEKDKEYFFGCNATGFIAYMIVDKVVVCMGDPICAKENLSELLYEFMFFSKSKGYKVCFCSISKEFSSFISRNGFFLAKYGEEALLDLCSYELKGSSTSKLRQKLKRAEKAGIQVIEYAPQKQRNDEMEKKIRLLSEEWLANKSGKLGFALGDLNLDRPLDRRYFAAVDEKNDLQAILVFSPFAEGQGYFLDVMRRSAHSVPGVMEKSIIDASMQMKNEGIRVVSLGLAPLAGMDSEQGSKNLLERGMSFVYKNMKQGYDFKALHDYKRKFAPTRWEPRYVAYESRLSPLAVAYVMIKARHAEGIWKQLLNGLWATRKMLSGQNK